MPELRDLPSVDTLLTDPSLLPLIQRYGVKAVRDCIRTLQQDMRIDRQVPDWGTTPDAYAVRIAQALRGTAYTPVFNLTGTVIHTNLGRALLSDALWSEVASLVTRPMNLEYDLDAGARGDRDAIVERQLCRLTGAEAATVVNNNAAALLLCLNTFAQGRQVPVSRGELIEIGGSFRLPELMSRSGCELREVGTTNRTHLADFAAVAAEAAMLLKVHPSNYYISGFASEVRAAELASLAQQHGIPSCVDLGSGTLVDLGRWGLPEEPTPQSVLADGIDLVTFSGDKLMGAVQAGIIVGKRELLAQIKKNPLKRALRADKITLAVLATTLRHYEDPEHLPQHVPLLGTLALDSDELQQRGARILSVLEHLSPAWQVALEPSRAQIGSGALPDKTLPSWAVTLRHQTLSPHQIADRLRQLSTPVIGRISEDRVWLDMRGAEPATELEQVLAQLREARPA